MQKGCHSNFCWSVLIFQSLLFLVPFFMGASTSRFICTHSISFLAQREIQDSHSPAEVQVKRPGDEVPSHLQVGHGEQRQQCERHQVEEGRLSGPEHLRRHGGRHQAQEVANQRTVEIPVNRGRGQSANTAQRTPPISGQQIQNNNETNQSAIHYLFNR